MWKLSNVYISTKELLHSYEVFNTDEEDATGRHDVEVRHY